MIFSLFLAFNDWIFGRWAKAHWAIERVKDNVTGLWAGGEESRSGENRNKALTVNWNWSVSVSERTSDWLHRKRPGEKRGETRKIISSEKSEKREAGPSRVCRWN